jgi:hypothetical protein
MCVCEQNILYIDGAASIIHVYIYISTPPPCGRIICVRTYVHTGRGTMLRVVSFSLKNTPTIGSVCMFMISIGTNRNPRPFLYIIGRSNVQNEYVIRSRAGRCLNDSVSRLATMVETGVGVCVLTVINLASSHHRFPSFQSPPRRVIHSRGGEYPYAY